MLDQPRYVDVRKWPDRPHWHYQVFDLGEDEHGRWFCLPGGSVIQRRPDAPRRHAGTTAKLIPAHGAWLASFNALPHQLDVYVDVIAEPARLVGGRIEMIDLDLDVGRDLAGDTHLLDVDEFEAHRVLLGYPEDVVVHARRTAEALMAAVTARQEPFGRDGFAWLERALERAWTIDPNWLGA